MSQKPYEKLLDHVTNDEKITVNNRKGLVDFLSYETPGSCLFTKWKNPPIIESGKGTRVKDVDGKEYLDCITGMSSMNIGHGDERIAKVMFEQYKKLSHWFDFPTPERLKLAEKLCEITPGNFKKKVWFGLSGADVVDATLRAVRYHTKRTQIISFHGGYHGQNIGTMGLTTKPAMWQWYNPVPPADSGISRFPYPYCYRCQYEKDVETCDMFCVRAIENIISTGENVMCNPKIGVNNVAAIIVEPMQCSAGYIMPPTSFLKKLRELADKYNILLVFDEIQTGMGRTGTMWGCEYSEVAPDIMIIGKALGAGIPMSAIIAREEILADLAPGMSSNTYAGYALGCAVSNKVFEIYEEDKLLENCQRAGEYMAKKLKTYIDKHPMVGTYSHKGVFLGIEYIRDNNKTPAIEETIDLTNLLSDNGLLAQRNGYFGNRISFLSTITMQEDDIDLMFDILEKATSEIEQKYKINF